MQLVEERPNVELRRDGDGSPIVVLAFPYDPHVVALVRRIPGRRFDWDRREWYAPVDDWAGVHVADVVDRFPELTTSAEVDAWLRAVDRRWVGRITTARHDGRGWFALHTRAGAVPEVLLDGRGRAGERHAARPARPRARPRPSRSSARRASTAPPSAASRSCSPGPTRSRPRAWSSTTASRASGSSSRCCGTPRRGTAFERLPGAEPAARLMPLDPWVVDTLDGFLARHGVAVSGSAADALDDLRDRGGGGGGGDPPLARDDRRADRRDRRAPRRDAAALPVGRRPLRARRPPHVPGRRAGPRQDGRGARDARGRRRLPGGRHLPRVAEAQLGARDEALAAAPRRRRGRGPQRGPARPARSRSSTTRSSPRTARSSRACTRARSSSTSRTTRRTRRPSARRRSAAWPRRSTTTRLRLALTGTPVLNHADELISQLRVIGRLEDFGSGARFSRQFQGPLTEERLHWHLRRRCFVRRLKSEVLPQLPPKRRVVVPVALDNQREYRLAEQDVVAWLREQPLDLSELNARIAATLRAERLAQLTTLQRLAARGKLSAALQWIADFLESGEPLVVFARHVDIQRAVLERFPDAAHLLGADALGERDEAVRAFQRPDGPQLIVAATRVAAQGITLTRASNVAFLELEWTPAMHDQAEDRTHRIGQRDAVTAWYLLAAETIDETMAELVEAKRSHISAVTDGRRLDGEGLVEGVVRELREGRPFRHLRPVA